MRMALLLAPLELELVLVPLRVWVPGVRRIVAVSPAAGSAAFPCTVCRGAGEGERAGASLLARELTPEAGFLVGGPPARVGLPEPEVLPGSPILISSSRSDR